MRLVKVCSLVVLQLLCFISFAAAQESQGVLEISFDYKRQGGTGSNQFAVWIEDASGNVVKTLYATRFTAQGGWKKRAESIPQWVAKSGIKNMKKDEYDVLTGSTPRAGNLKYTWDGTNQAGQPAAPGVYTVCVEGSLRFANRVLYTGTVTLGGPASESQAASRYWGDSTAERNMIGPVLLTYKPKK